MLTSIDLQLGVASQGGGVSIKVSFLGEVFPSVPLLVTFPGCLDSLFLSPTVKVTLFLELQPWVQCYTLAVVPFLRNTMGKAAESPSVGTPR